MASLFDLRLRPQAIHALASELLVLLPSCGAANDDAGSLPNHRVLRITRRCSSNLNPKRGWSVFCPHFRAPALLGYVHTAYFDELLGTAINDSASPRFVS